MPRGGGGGSRGGGGFRGGSFGGGFRGGGFRGGSGSSRGGYRGGGRPFGRTGATRVTSRSPRGPYSHRYYGPHRRYYRPYWWYHRPWYYRWWYSPYWAGHYYRPWYYSPVYMGGGILFLIVLTLIILPVAGVALLFPFNNADVDGYVNYRSTETLYFNEFWFEHEYVEEGDMTFSVQSSSVNINFAIDNRPFEHIPLTTMHIPYNGPITIPSGSTHDNVWMYLKPGSSIDYEFNSSGLVDFQIIDIENSIYINEQNTPAENGSLLITSENDYFVVWENRGGTSIDVDFSVNFNATDVVDFSQTDFHINTTSSIPQQTFIVPQAGEWYFFIYFEPINVPPPDTSTVITFDVTYNTGLTAQDRWINIQWILIIILVVVVIILIAAVVARRGQKKLKLKAPTTPDQKKVSPYKTTPPKTVEKETKCARCNASIKPDSKLCPKCGGKIEGRQIGVPSITTPATAKTCSLCGSKLTGTESFCKWCGTQIEQ